MTGHPRELWDRWEELLLRDSPEPRISLRPYVDPELRTNRDAYAQFLLRMYDLDMIEFSSPRGATLGLFFVLKTDGSGRLRLILDTRLVNQSFREPESTALPAASVWQSLCAPRGAL